jgi:hypothetical protein
VPIEGQNDGRYFGGLPNADRFTHDRLMPQMNAVERPDSHNGMLPFRDKRPEPEMNLHQVRVYRRRRASAEIANTAI